MLSYKIVLVGHFGVGKTSLIRRFVDNSFSEEYLSTIGVSISKKMIGDATVMIWDIEGHTEFKPIFKQYFMGSKGFIIVADLLREETIEEIKNHIALCHEVVKDAPLVIALNKCDMPHTFNQEQIDKLKQLSPKIIKVVKTSAKEAQEVETLFNELNQAISSSLID